MIEWVLTLFYLVIFSLLIIYLPFFKGILSKPLLLIFFFLKVLAGIGLYYIYTHIYPDRCNADIFKYFDDSKIMYQALFAKPLDYFKMMTGIANDSDYFNHMYYYKMNNWFRLFDSSALNDNHIIIRLNAFFHLFSFGHYQVHNVCMNFLSFTGLVALYKAFFYLLPSKKYSLMMVIFLIPSVLFWTSGVLKEGLLMFGLGLFLYACINLIHVKRIWFLYLILLLSIVILLQIKVYILTLLFPLILIYFWCEKYPLYKGLKYSFSIVLGISILIISQIINPNLNLITLLSIKQQSFINIAITMDAGSFIQPPAIDSNPIYWMPLALKAIYNTVWMPLVFFKSNFLMLFSAIENLIILTAISIAGISAFKNYKNINNIFLFSLIFVCLSFILIGIITPVMGAIVRYRVPALPFLGIACIILINTTYFEKNIHALLQKIKLI